MTGVSLDTVIVYPYREMWIGLGRRGCSGVCEMPNSYIYHDDHLIEQGGRVDMNPKLGVIEVLTSCFTISSLGGMAALLRSGKVITWRTGASAFLYSGIMGLVIGLVWYQYFSGQDNVYFLIGVSGLAGLGGTTLLDFVMQVMAKGGVSIIVVPKDDAVPPQQPSKGE